MASAEQTAAFPFSLETLNNLSTNQKVGGMVAVALAIAILAGAWMWSKSVDYNVLFSNISEHDGGQIVTVLQQMNVPYKFSESGGAILVPATQVHDIRLKLASQGLPKGGLVGFEVMETQKLGASQFLEQVNYQRALEGELARSIQSLQAVHTARVHLAIPKSSAFLRDEQKPTASVVLNLYPGRALDQGQVAGIVHLVASSVPQLTPASISVIDQGGNLISKVSDQARDAGLDPAQLKYLRDLEISTIKRIETILEPVAGAGNVRAQVAADVDFSQTEQMAETYAPNPPPGTAIRSQQSSESSNGTTGPAGVPGALSNQPPVPATAPLTTPPAPGTPGAASTNTAQPTSFNKNATTNYELDKTIKHTKGGSGSIKRLSVAVVVNYKKGPPDKDGKVKAAPLVPAEIQQINDLVREAMGFNKERGDTLSVANVSFNTEKETLPDLPFWKSPEFIALLRENFKYLAVALVAFFIWKKMLQPILHSWQKAEDEKRRLAQEAAERALAAANAEDGTLAHNMRPVHREFDAKVAAARDLAKADPKLVANVIKGWVTGNEQ